MKNKIIIACSSLVVLIIFFMINLKTQQSLQSSSSKIFSIDKNIIQKIIIKSNDDMIELSKLDTTWMIIGHDSLQCKQNLIDSFFDRVLTLESETIMTKNQNKWSIYSVDDYLGTHLEIIDSNANSLGAYIFGSSSSDFSRCYMRKIGSPEVLLVHQNVMYNLQVNPNYWGEVIKELTPSPNQEL